MAIFFAIKHESKLSIVFLNINFTLPHTYFHVKRLKMAKFVLLLLDPHCTGIITELVLEKNQQYWKFSRMFWNNSVVIRFEKTSVFFLFILYFLVSLAQQFGKFWFFFHVGCFFSVLHFALEICQFPNYFGISVLCFI